ncbi:MAG: protein kinase [Nitrospirota bacterium]
MIHQGTIERVTPSLKETFCYLLDISVPMESGEVRDSPDGGSEKTAGTLQMKLCSRFLDILPREVANDFLKHMTFRHIKKGERFITQGLPCEDFYLILRGSCTVSIEKKGIICEIEKLGPGDIAGETALLSDGQQGAHVIAETSTDVLGMNRGEFERLSLESGELRNFLSSMVMHRLSASKVESDRKIGKYTVTGKIGHGGASIIYKGFHSALNMPVVIKMLMHEMAMDSDFLGAFRNEALAIAQLNHPNIVKVYDIEDLYRTLFIVMEYLEGITLKEILENGPRPPLSRIVDIVLQVCYGLEYAHNHGIIHQDINPRNIFVQSDGRVKIIDFGLACRPGSVDANFLFPGTLHYISPEQIRGNPVDERTDIYSLGITAYEMIAGQRPFSGEDMKSVISWHLDEDIHDTRATMEQLPVEIHNFLMRSVRKDPASRYPNISEALKDLRPLAERLGFREPCFCKQNRMMGMFLVYQEKQQLALKGLIEDFSKKVGETGAALKITQFEDMGIEEKK